MPNLSSQSTNAAVQRHQLHWMLENGGYTPLVTCLHTDMPEGVRCDGLFFMDEPQTLVDGHIGVRPEIRDGIILSHWTGERGSLCTGADLRWTYEVNPYPAETQRHVVRFVLGETDGFGLAEPIFECLHSTTEHGVLVQCHADAWREEIGIFPEWYEGPATPIRAGTIVSWWAGEPSDESLPSWVYEQHAPGIIPTEPSAPSTAAAS